MRAASSLLLLWALGCSNPSKPPPTKVVIKPFDAGPCGVVIKEVVPQGATHRDIGTPLTFPSNPPAGGDHYPVWITWGAHEKAISPGFWVHNLEHGGVAFLYRCANRAACPALAAQVEGVANALPQDALCEPPIKNRIVVVPDPDLPEGIEVAAAVWGVAMTARCFDAAALKDFYLNYGGNGPEATCAQGSAEVDSVTDGGVDGALDMGL